jgi:8-oxo-dGTP pyrophosphatase MutT (NUDIX family)
MADERDLERTREQLARAIADAVHEAAAVADNDVAWRHASWLADELASGVSRTSRLRTAIARRWQSAEQLSVRQLSQRLGLSPGRTGDMLRERGSARAPEPEPVVAAIVTSPLGVLVTHRRDGTPPWGFVAGKIEPGESPADAALREVKEETGLTIAVGRELGRRVHPDTGRTIIYVSAEPLHRTDTAVGDPAELDDVRWVPVSEAAELMPGMYEPVRAYLAREPRRRQSRAARG